MKSEIEYLELKGCVFTGVSFTQRIGGKNTVPREWERNKANGVTALLLKLPDRCFGDALLGWMGNYNATTKEFEYCIGVVTRGHAAESLPPSCLQHTLPDCLLALGTIATGPQGAHGKNKRLYERDGYELDMAKGFEIEYYEGEKGSGVFKYGSPVKKSCRKP